MHRTVRSLALLLLASLVVGGGWATYQRLVADTQFAGSEFRHRLRAPAYAPEWLYAQSLVLEEPKLPVGSSTIPYAMQRWWTPPESSLPSIMVVFGATATEVNIDTEGKAPVKVDGVHGWLWRLDEDDLTPPQWPNAHSEETHRTRKVYVLIEGYRRLDKVGNRGLVGPAIALQWNKDGIHYVLIAGDRDPMTEEVLLRMANSLGPPVAVVTPPSRPQ